MWSTLYARTFKQVRTDNSFSGRVLRVHVRDDTLLRIMSEQRWRQPFSPLLVLLPVFYGLHQCAHVGEHGGVALVIQTLKIAHHRVEPEHATRLGAGERLDGEQFRLFEGETLTTHSGVVVVQVVLATLRMRHLRGVGSICVSLCGITSLRDTQTVWGEELGQVSVGFEL